MEYKAFYTELGKLLYAVAKADGEVQEEELFRIYQMVVNEISDKSLFDRENEVDAYIAEFEFESMVERDCDMQKSINSFIDFYEKNQSDFTVHLKTVIIKSMETVAEAFEGIIPEEQRLINLLKEKLWE